MQTNLDPDAINQDFRACAEIACRVYTDNRERPEGLRKAAFLGEFAEACPIRIYKGELIVGPHYPLEGLNRWMQALGEERLQGMAFHGNMGHVIVDYARVLRLGVDGLLERIQSMPGESAVHAVNQEAFRTTAQGFARLIQRFGEAAARLADADAEPADSSLHEVAANCRHLSHHPPQTFWQALQLVWFVQVFLHAESMNSAISFGRFDQYLGPYLERDLANNRITIAQARELLADFWKKTNTIGDPSQNLIVGGLDAAGKCAENTLSFLCLDVARELHLPQPSLSVRIGPETSGKFWEKALALCTAGFGMPSFFNDPVVIRSLESLDIPSDRARDWGIVGCYEANPQGDTLGLTVANGFSLPEVFLEYFNRTTTCDTFAEFLAGFKKHLSAFYLCELSKYQDSFDRVQKDYASPFQSLCLTDCIERGLTAEEGGALFRLYGVNIVGLGTLVDCFLAVKELVFERREISLDAFQQQLAADFPDEALLTRCRNLAGKYGTASDFTDRLAQELLRETAELVLSHPLKNGVRPYPAFFRWLHDVYSRPGATPDGRRKQDRISYGVGPTEFGKGKSVTSVLLSAAHLAHDRCACGNPLTLSLSHNEVEGVAGANRLKNLIGTYFREGGFHLHVNIVDAQQLREAREKPHEHGELTVRISGLSARFVGLDNTLQNAIIERTERHM